MKENSKEKKNYNNIYFSEGIDSKGAFYAEKILFLGSLILFLATLIVFVAFQIIGYKNESYWLNILQLFGGFVCVCAPLILRRFKLYINSYLAIIWYVFMIASFYFGLNFEVYKMGEWYDKVVHAFSGVVVGLFGLSLISFSGKKIDKLKAFIIIIAVASLAGLGWEIVEFTHDSIMGDNSQRYSDVATKENFVGQKALYDTMFDMIADFAGGLVTAIAVMFIKPKYLHRFAITSKKEMIESIDKENNNKENN